MPTVAQLPSFTYFGYLPEGIHDCALEELRERLATNPQRERLWEHLANFLAWARATGNFSQAYIGGGFVSEKYLPKDIDVVLETRFPYGPEAFRAMEPFFAFGLEKIFETYSVHLHFWAEGFPGGINDFRRFFQYMRPQDAAPLGLKEGAKKGIVRLSL